MKSKSTYRSWLWFVHDGLLWTACLTGAFYLRFPAEVPHSEWDYYWRFMPMAGAALLFGLLYRGVYQSNLENEWSWRDIWWGWLIGTGLSALVLVGLKIPFSRWVFTVASGSYLAVLVLNRGLVLKVKTLFGNDHAWQVATVGFDDTAPIEQSLSSVSHEIEDFQPEGLSRSLEELTEQSFDLVLLNSSSLSNTRLEAILSFGSRYELPVRLYPSAREELLSDTSFESWHGLRLLRSNLHNNVQQQLAVKRVFDFVLSVSLFPMVIPLCGLIGLMILIFDGRPIFFAQARAGRGGEPFSMCKFRTMDTDTDGPELTEGPDDPRITTLGRILRRFSLDELPQIWHILKGEMSFVGPRPEIPSITRDYSETQRTVLWVKPGLTGLSQVSGREQLELDEKLEIDRIYLQEYSIGMDLWILLKTAWVVLSGEGAN